MSTPRGKMPRGVERLFYDGCSLVRRNMYLHGQPARTHLIYIVYNYERHLYSLRGEGERVRIAVAH